MHILIEAYFDIATAIDNEQTMSVDNVCDLLEITDSDSLETGLDKLLTVALNPNVRTLPYEQRLAAIKTCQVIIGHLFRIIVGIDSKFK